jgi:DNA-binding response OmpR family regulator
LDLDQRACRVLEGETGWRPLLISTGMSFMEDTASFSSISSSRILVVDSDVASRLKWSRMLEIMGFQVFQAGSGEEALAQLELTQVELAFFDLPLPDIGDPQLLQQARKQSSRMLIIVQNNQPTVESTVAAIKVGAVDYLIGLANSTNVVDTITSALKKRALERERQHELLSHQFESYLERKGLNHRNAVDELPSNRQLITHGDLLLDRQARCLTVRGDKTVQVELTKGEVDVLASLMSRPETALSCQEIVRVAFRYDSAEDEARSVVRPYISRLRRKFEDGGLSQQSITTIRGRGYKFVAATSDASGDC